MPLYIYQNEQTKEVKEIFQSMNQKHEYFGENGNEKWNRIFTIPQASIDTKQDPFDSNQYVRQTGSKKGTYGDLLNHSKELSKKREQIAGKDPIKEKYYSDYSKNRKGAKHPDQFKKTIETSKYKIQL